MFRLVLGLRHAKCTRVLDTLGMRGGLGRRCGRCTVIAVVFGSMIIDVIMVVVDLMNICLLLFTTFGVANCNRIALAVAVFFAYGRLVHHCVVLIIARYVSSVGGRRRLCAYSTCNGRGRVSGNLVRGVDCQSIFIRRLLGLGDSWGSIVAVVIDQILVREGNDSRVRRALRYWLRFTKLKIGHSST